MCQLTFAKACYTHAPDIDWAPMFGAPHYLAQSLDNPKQIAYSAKDSIGPNDHAQRTRTTLGRYLVRQHKLELDSSIIERIMRDCTKQESVSEEFEILRGEDIPQAYRNAVGGRSCMTKPDTWEFTRFYARYPKRIGLLVWKETTARAVLWKTDCDKLIVDRIYSGTPSAQTAYSAWANENGAQLIQDTDRDFEVTLGDSVYDGEIPYMDSFYGLSISGGILSTARSAYDLQCTSGGPFATERYTCERCEESCDELRHIDGQDVCLCCAEDTRYCERCDNHTFADITEIDGQDVCECCAENANCCDRCDGRTFDDMTDIDGQDVCECCAEDANVCDHCDAQTFDDLQTIDNGDCCGCCVAHFARELLVLAPAPNQTMLPILA